MTSLPLQQRLLPEVSLAMPGQTPGRAANAEPSAQAVMDAMRVPVLLLDAELRVVNANRAFHLTFGLTREDVLGRPIDALGDGQWNTPELRALLETILPRRAFMDGHELEGDFAGLGRRTMLLNARGLSGGKGAAPMILLAIEDITEQRAAERAACALAAERDALLHELPRRVATSLQVIASVLRASARTAASAEARRHLADAHERVLSLTALQRQVRAAEAGATVELGPYLSSLCAILAPAQAGARHPVSVQTRVGQGAVSSGRAVSIGLAATELVVNALEHAFPDDQEDATVTVGYDQTGPDWTLTVSDNGAGRPAEQWDRAYPGLGTIVVEAVVKRLDATLEVEMDTDGTTVAVVHGKRLAAAAPDGRAPCEAGGASRTRPDESIRQNGP